MVIVSASPIPPAEKSLPTITAKEWFKVSDEGMQLEGPVFTPNGDLIFCEVFEGRIFRLTPEGELSEVLGKNELRPAGIESDKEGNLYVAELGNFDDEGSVHESVSRSIELPRRPARCIRPHIRAGQKGMRPSPFAKNGRQMPPFNQT